MQSRLLCIALVGIYSVANAQFKITKNEFIYTKASFPSCHASTIAETPNGLVVSYFGGTDEGHKDVGIWVSRQKGRKWTAPVEVANGIQNDTLRHPCWNPVLFYHPNGQLLLFYKVGPSPRAWWGMLIRSVDNGITWSKPEKLPDGFLGPIKNKPILLANGNLLCPSSTEHNGWRLQFEITPDLGKTWQMSSVVPSSEGFEAIQPTLITTKNGTIKQLCRSKNDKILECESTDGGYMWTPLKPTPLLNPSSGIDAVTLKNGQHMLVYNDRGWTSRKTNTDREQIDLALSDNGINWRKIMVLEQIPFMEFSYPAIIQTADNKIHITYTWKRERIKHLVIRQ